MLITVGIIERKYLLKRGNYTYFLRKFYYYMASKLNIYAYCLLPNHFHFLVRIKDQPSLKNLACLNSNISKRNPISQAFSRFFNAYTKAVNKQEGRTGNLFQRYFKKMLIE